jgi:bacteriocin-like protein
LKRDAVKPPNQGEKRMPKKKSQKPAEELSEEQLETVSGGIALAVEGSEEKKMDTVGAHHVDKSSPVLMQVCANGTHMKEATITH